MSNYSRPRGPGTPRTHVPVRCARRACREVRRRRQQSPFKRKIAPTRARRQPAMLVSLPASIVLARVAYTRPCWCDFSLKWALLPSPSHLTACAAGAANGHVCTGSVWTVRATTSQHRGLKSSQARRFLKAKTQTFRTVCSLIARAAGTCDPECKTLSDER